MDCDDEEAEYLKEQDSIARKLCSAVASGDWTETRRLCDLPTTRVDVGTLLTGTTALHKAAMYDQFDIIDLLLSRGADTNVSSSPLNSETVARAKPELSEQSLKNTTANHIAAQMCQPLERNHNSCSTGPAAQLTQPLKHSARRPAGSSDIAMFKSQTPYIRLSTPVAVLP